MSESPRHGLDEAIDRVAAKMVAADADAGVLHRVLAQLPERVATPWFLRLPVQATAAAAIVAAALVYPRPSREFAPLESAPVAMAKPAEVRPEAAVGEPVLAAVPRLPTPDRLPTPTFARATVGRPDSRLPSAAPGLPAAAPDRPDHERSLAPVATIAALELDEIAPSAMELDATAALEPLVLPELALVPQGDS